MICTQAWKGRARRAGQVAAQGRTVGEEPGAAGRAAGCAGGLHGRLQQFRQPVQVLRAEGDVDEREAREEALLLGLRQAAGHEHDARRVAALETRRLAEVTGEALVGAAPDRARVVDGSRRASSGAATAASPSASRACLMRSASCSFIWHPNERR